MLTLWALFLLSAMVISWALDIDSRLTLAQVAPILPYLLLVVMLIVRPKGLLGTRED